jgi:hypothetical protein
LRALSGANIELLGEAVFLATPDGQVRLARSVEPALLGAAGNVAVTGVPGSGKTVLQAADIHPRPAENGRQAQCGAVAEVRRHARWAQRSPPASRSFAPTGGRAATAGLPGPGFLRDGCLLVGEFGIELAGECVQALVGPLDPAVAKCPPGHGFPCRD